MSDASRLRLEIVTIERLVYAGTVDMVLAPAVGGQVGILPSHAPLITRLESGELVARSAGGEQSFAIGGGLMEVLANRVVVLADTAESAEEIDVQRAQAARERAAQLVRRQLGRVELVRAEAALRRSLARLRVARRRAPASVAHLGGREALGED